MLRCSAPLTLGGDDFYKYFGALHLSFTALELKIIVAKHVLQGFKVQRTTIIVAKGDGLWRTRSFIFKVRRTSILVDNEVKDF